MKRLLRSAPVVWLAVSLALPAALEAARKKKAAEHAQLNGIVVDLEETPVRGVAVELTSPDGKAIGNEKTDKAGAFDMKIDNAAGEYSLRLTKEGFAPFQIPVTLTAGEGYSYTFKLLDAATGQKQEAVQAFNDGAALYQEEDFAAAKAKFLAARDGYPELPAPHLALADVLVGEGDLAAASSSVEQFMALAPDDVRGPRLAYRIYHDLGDRARLRALVPKLTGTDYATPLARQAYNEGVAAMQNQDTQGAIDHFETAKALDPSLGAAVAGLATLQFNARDYEGLRASLDELDGLEPGNAQGLRLRFLLHEALGDDEAAMTAWDAYSAVEPARAVTLLYERADLAFQGGETAAAKRALLKIVAIEPPLPRAVYTLGLVYASEGDNAKAREHLERFLALAPEDSEAPAAREMLPHLQ